MKFSTVWTALHLSAVAHYTAAAAIASSSSAIQPATPTPSSRVHGKPTSRPLINSSRPPPPSTPAVQLPGSSSANVPLSSSVTLETSISDTSRQTDSTSATTTASDRASDGVSSNSEGASDTSLPSSTIPSSTPAFASPSDIIHGIPTDSGANLVALIPIIKTWETNPSPPIQTDALNLINGVKDNVVKLISNLGGDPSSSGCSGKKKRGLVDSIFDVAGGILSGLSCITNNINNLAQEIQGGDIAAVKTILGNLVSNNNDTPDNDDNPTSTAESTTTESTTVESSTLSSQTTSSSCTSDITAYQVTVLCEPTSITSDGSVTSTLTCSPTTTVTATGCSVTGTTATVTSTPTPTDVCALGTCGEACSKGGSGKIVAIVNSIDCASITPTRVSEMPTESAGAVSDIGLSIRRRDHGFFIRADSTPLPTNPWLHTLSLPGPDADVDWRDYLIQASHEITRRRGWIGQNFATTGKWYPFVPHKARGAAGVKGIFGCTSVMIVTRFGVYISHIFENPVFVDIRRDATPDEFFKSQSFGALRYGGDGIEAVESLVGTDDAPGVLHPMHEPQVFVITPFVDSTKQEWLYSERAKWLSDQFGLFFYPNGYGHKPPIIKGYIRTRYDRSNNDNKLEGKAIMEVASVDSVIYPDHGPRGVRPFAIGRWRLWVGGEYLVDYRFWDPNGTPEVVDGQFKRRDVDYGTICPDIWGDSGANSSTESTSTTEVSTISSGIETASTFTTSPKPKTTHSADDSTTTTTVEPVNPPGPPPSLTLQPTAEPIPATSTTMVEPVNPPGPPPSLTLQPTAEPIPATSTPDSPATPLASDPSQVSEQKCWGTDVFDHGPVEQVAVQQVAEMCRYDALSNDEISMGPGEKLSWDAGIPEQTVYYAEISWLENCEGPEQNAQTPMDGYDCVSLIVDSWEKCTDNDGAGGYIIVGCLSYMFMPQLPSVWYPT
ncbi:hypothetical protein FE257_010112 [Aspergillus nanangensis]|uniref:Uncharacterized protein n=1 Tax=Aspergillus nanangensis TaxID=2582783 RepID=A0AAD4GRK8_ASPNN|nr:hypothetical protein FE257_010112 [Aspergillus nanangensis]